MADRIDTPQEIQEMEIIGSFFINEMCNEAALAALRSKGDNVQSLYSGYRARFLDIMDPSNSSPEDANDRIVYMTALVEFVKQQHKSTVITLEFVLNTIASFILPGTYMKVLGTQRDVVVQSIIHKYCIVLDQVCTKLAGSILARDSQFGNLIITIQDTSLKIFLSIRNTYLMKCIDAESNIVGGTPVTHKGKTSSSISTPKAEVQHPTRAPTKKKVAFSNHALTAVNTKSPSEKILKKRLDSHIILDGEGNPGGLTSTEKSEIKYLRKQIDYLSRSCDEFDDKFRDQEERFQSLAEELDALKHLMATSCQLQEETGYTSSNTNQSRGNNEETTALDRSDYSGDESGDDGHDRENAGNFDGFGLDSEDAIDAVDYEQERETATNTVGSSGGVETDAKSPGEEVTISRTRRRQERSNQK